MKMCGGVFIGIWLSVLVGIILNKTQKIEVRETEKLENSVVFSVVVPESAPPIKYLINKGDGSVQWGYLSHKEKP